MAAVELPDGKEVKGRNKESNPTGKGDGVEQHIFAGPDRGQHEGGNGAKEQWGT